MASNSSKNIDHGNYIPSPIVPGIKIAVPSSAKRMPPAQMATGGYGFGDIGSNG